MTSLKSSYPTMTSLQGEVNKLSGFGPFFTGVMDDMILERDQLINLMHDQITNTTNKNHVRRGKNAIRNGSYRWPNNTLPFYISSSSPDHGVGPNTGFDLSPVSEAVHPGARGTPRKLGQKLKRGSQFEPSRLSHSFNGLLFTILIHSRSNKARGSNLGAPF